MITLRITPAGKFTYERGYEKATYELLVGGLVIATGEAATGALALDMAEARSDYLLDHPDVLAEAVVRAALDALAKAVRP